MNHQPTNTAIKAALKKAGAQPVGAAMLYNLAVEHLRRTKLDTMRAARGLTQDVRAEGGLMVALISEQETYAAAREYIENVARDMRGKTVSREQREGAVLTSDESRAARGRSQLSPQGGAGVRSADEIHANTGPGENSARADGAVHARRESQLQIGRSDKSPTGADDATVLMSRESPSLAGRASSNLPEGAVPVVAHFRGKAKRGLDEMKAVKAAHPSIFDTLMLRDGMPLGDLRFSQLDRYIAANAREAALLEMVRKYGIPADPNMKIRDVVREADMQKMVLKSAGAAHAQA